MFKECHKMSVQYNEGLVIRGAGWSGMRYGIREEVWPALFAATMASYKGQMKVAKCTQE
jgi:hypothetical protein